MPNHINASAGALFEVLRVIAGASQELGPAEISAITGVPVGRVQRALVTLERLFFIRRSEPSRKFVLGYSARSLGIAALKRFPLREAALPILRRAASASRGEATLHGRMGSCSLLLAKAHTQHSAIGSGRIGERTALHASEPGLAMLAHLGQNEVDEYVANCAVLRRADIRASLGKRLRTIRDRGFAVNDSPGGSDFVCEVAFPILATNAEPLGAVLLRFNRDVLPERKLDIVIAKGRAIVSDLTALVMRNPEDFAAPYGQLTQ